MGSTGFIDILILAMIAAFLVFRLRSALGRRTGHQRPPPSDSFPHEAREAEDSGDTVIHLPDRKAERQEKRARDVPPPVSAASGPAAAEDSGDAASALAQLKIADPGFDEADFLDGARIAFEMILGAFAEGDRGVLESLLADDVLARFVGEIERRERAGETCESALVSFRSTAIAAARVDGLRAAVTVAFDTEQINIVRDSDENLLSGDERKVERIADVWTFERDLHSNDPNWRLVETRSGD